MSATRVTTPSDIFATSSSVPWGTSPNSRKFLVSTCDSSPSGIPKRQFFAANDFRSVLSSSCVALFARANAATSRICRVASSPSKVAPSLIQVSIASTTSFFSGGRRKGIRSPAIPFNFLTSKLSPGLPGKTAAPLSPPRINPLNVVRLNPPLARRPFP